VNLNNGGVSAGEWSHSEPQQDRARGNRLTEGVKNATEFCTNGESLI
jgi:hypothetical protein